MGDRSAEEQQQSGAMSFPADPIIHESEEISGGIAGGWIAARQDIRPRSRVKPFDLSFGEWEGGHSEGMAGGTPAPSHS